MCCVLFIKGLKPPDKSHLIELLRLLKSRERIDDQPVRQVTSVRMNLISRDGRPRT